VADSTSHELLHRSAELVYEVTSIASTREG
jgi:hypothetical protein